jgi:hypothetical protein
MDNKKIIENNSENRFTVSAVYTCKENINFKEEILLNGDF